MTHSPDSASPQGADAPPTTEGRRESYCLGYLVTLEVPATVTPGLRPSKFMAIDVGGRSAWGEPDESQAKKEAEQLAGSYTNVKLWRYENGQLSEVAS